LRNPIRNKRTSSGKNPSTQITRTIEPETQSSATPGSSFTYQVEPHQSELKNYPTPVLTATQGFPPGFPTPDPEEFDECKAQGGRWDILGFNGPGCNLPTTDGGKSCSDSKECESACLANSDEIWKKAESGLRFPDSERIDEINAQGKVIGACSNWRANFGCHVWVEEGQYAYICVD
jgi:hypothetical protein